MKIKWILFAILLTVGFALPAICAAHSGRRFEVKTDVDGGLEKLYAQGYNSSGTDDGGGVTRSYTNAIHDHWGNVFGAATSGLPSFDVITPGSLQGYALYAELVGVTKWVDPPLVEMDGMMMVPSGTVPVLEPLTFDNLFVSNGTEMISNSALGTLLLDDSVSSFGEHLDLIYGIDLEPANALYAVEWILSTDAPGVMASDSIYAILSPDGSNMTEKMHADSLSLESYLGNGSSVGGGLPMVPEPSSMLLLCIGTFAFGLIGRSRYCSVVFRDR